MKRGTSEIVQAQLEAMQVDQFEIGVLMPGQDNAKMIPREWTKSQTIHSTSWLAWQNASNNAQIYVRPRGEHQLTLVDDLKLDSLHKLARDGFQPAVVVETSPGNYQAWLNHGKVLNAEVSTAAAKVLAKRYGADQNAAAWRQFGRLAGFTNRKPKYQNVVTGQYPFCRLGKATGEVYHNAPAFTREIEQAAALKRQQDQLRQQQFAGRQYTGPLKTVEAFRADQRYGGDMSRAEQAYSLYALSHGVSTADVAAALRTRPNLIEKKGSVQQAEAYVNRTVQKAANSVRCR